MDSVIAEIFETARRKLTVLLTVFKLVLIDVAFVLTAFTRLLTVRNPAGAGILISSEPSPTCFP